MGVKLVPTWAWLAIIGGLLLLCSGLYARGSMHKTAFAEFRAKTAENLTRASEAARLEEQRRQAAADEGAQHAADEKRDLESTVRLLADVGDGLRNDLAAFQRRANARACPAGRSASEPSADPIGVLAELYARADREAASIARYADELRIAGGACERIADKVSAQP